MIRGSKQFRRQTIRGLMQKSIPEVSHLAKASVFYGFKLYHTYGMQI